ncbi:hypothetical protein [Flavobacterium sp. 14A]|uniref:hypothetical protein n=1 Tax=Flavobacterium sp. 14A TaxID=2735896 RepID=UPI001570347B|nr:hypothetical protein [Flavobacterium sp. 14A]NRT11504.1 hypothetical protein [Flavobacterium sp. 14A]
MTKEEEILKLREFPHHYLWNKRRSEWTEADLYNLENADENSRKCNGKNVNNQQPVIQILDGEKIQFESCSEASRRTGVSIQGIYRVVNGHQATAGGCKWEKASN